jgi:hypothetical protein
MMTVGGVLVVFFVFWDNITMYTLGAKPLLITGAQNLWQCRRPPNSDEAFPQSGVGEHNGLCRGGFDGFLCNESALAYYD